MLDASPCQLAQDHVVAEREGLDIRLVEGDMADLSAFAAASFALIVNPPSTVFVPDVASVCFVEDGFRNALCCRTNCASVT